MPNRNSKVLKLISASVASLMLFFGGWVVGQIRDDATQNSRLVQLEAAKVEHAAQLQKMRPAAEMVSKDEFQQFSARVLAELGEIKAEQIRTRESLERGHR